MRVDLTAGMPPAAALPRIAIRVCGGPLPAAVRGVGLFGPAAACVSPLGPSLGLV
jgi:hypothetical protein